MGKVKDYLFAVVAKDGSTPAVNPKLEAYKYMASLQMMGYRTSLTVQDGKYAVAAPGLLTLTYHKG